MQITVSWLLLLLGLVHAQQPDYHQQFAPQQYGLRIQHENSQTAGPTDYNYSYDVRDDITGDRKSQEESRSGDRVRGRYSLLDADGSTRTVEYSVDSQSGFNAVVRRDGDQISVPNPNSRAIPLHFNDHQNRRPSAAEVFRNRYQHEINNRLDTRTRLAQDARTGNVVDLHSGFGVAPHTRTHVLPTPVPRIQTVNRENLDNLHHDQGRTHGYETHEIQRSDDVQEILARSHYQTSHPVVHHQSTHHVDHHQSPHPIDQHRSTAPIHFPGSHHGAFGARANLAYERYSIRPATHEDVRRPSPIFADSNANREESRSNDNSNPQNLGEASNANYPNFNTFNQNVQYPIQHEEYRGPTTPIPVNPTLGYQITYHESNDSRIAYHGQSEFFGARINQNNRPTVQQIDTGSISVYGDSIITDAVTPTPVVTTVYPDAFVTPVPELYQDISRIPSSDNSNVDVTVNNVQNYLYPASTLPLQDNAPAHFFSGGDLATNGVSPLLNFHNFDVRNSLYNHLAAPHFAEPISHDAHLLK